MSILWKMFNLVRKFSTKPYVEKRAFPKTLFKEFIKPKNKKSQIDIPDYFEPTAKTKDKNKWDRTKKRTGVIGIKMGMIGIWDSWGVHHACTVIKLDNLQVIKILKKETKRNLFGMILGCSQRNWNRVTPSIKAICENANVPYKSKIETFFVSKDGLLPPGTFISVSHFVNGQLVDVKGKTNGKGFQGTIKRHGFKRQAKSHGVSKAHRKPGSQGMTGAGRVFPGKKGAGRMGGKNATILNLRVMKIDEKQNVMFLKGHVPGKPGTYVNIRDALFKPPKTSPPYPTYFPDPFEKEDKVTEVNSKHKIDPFVENLPVSKIPS